MYRAAMLIVVSTLVPSVAAAQQPCTTDANHVVAELYRHMLERSTDSDSAHWVQQLERGRLTVRAGELLTFDAEGTVQLGADPNDIADPGGARSGRRAAAAPLTSALAGTLVARIGTAGVIFVGDRRSLRAPSSGRLYLGVKDDHLADNSGEFRVTVTVD
ncbi:MAG: hypothetical protein HY657_03015 [Acidobacteria bacterium]|nr:hypothetical protein [Acidobacteriota bacterium]